MAMMTSLSSVFEDQSMNADVEFADNIAELI